jgi:hypothetical protein
MVGSREGATGGYFSSNAFDDLVEARLRCHSGKRRASTYCPISMRRCSASSLARDRYCLSM